MLTLPAGLLLMLVPSLQMHSLDQTLDEGGQTASSGGRRFDVHLDQPDSGAQDGLAPLSSDATFDRVFGPLHDAGSSLVGTCVAEDDPAVGDGSDDLLEAHASALLRCTLWTGIEAGGGGADDLEARTLEPMAFDPATDLDGTRLLGLGPQPESQTADIAGLMPWWTLSGPWASLATGADGGRTGVGGYAGGGTGGGSGVGGGAGGAGGDESGPTRGSRTSADDDVVRGGEPETPSDDSGNAGSDPLNALDTDGQDDDNDGDDHDPADGSPDPHDGGSTPIDIFPPSVIVPPPTGGPGGGPGGQPGGGPTQTQSVPEPATFLLAGAGLAALMIRRRTRV